MGNLPEPFDFDDIKNELLLHSASCVFKEHGEAGISKLVDSLTATCVPVGDAVSARGSKEQIADANKQTSNAIREVFAKLDDDQAAVCHASIVATLSTWLSAEKKKAKLQKLHDHLESALKEALKTFDPDAPAADAPKAASEQQAQQPRTGFADSFRHN